MVLTITLTEQVVAGSHSGRNAVQRSDAISVASDRCCKRYSLQDSPFHVRAMLYNNVVYGRTPSPSSPITVSLSSAAGRIKARATARTSIDGAFTILFGTRFTEFSPVPERIEPGDLLQVEWSSGDPNRVEIPVVTIESHPSSGQVTGSAPPGTRVSGELGGLWTEAKSDVTGRYALPLTSGAAIPRGTYGSIRFEISANLELESTWLAPKLTVDVTSGFSGTAPAGRRVSFDFLDQNGKTLDSQSNLVASDNIGGSVRGYTIDLSRLNGGHLRMERGDEIRAMIGDDIVATRVAKLSAQVSSIDDTVYGQTEPNRHVDIGVLKRTESGSVERKQIATRSDETGEFLANFSGMFDITAANNVDVSVADADGHLTVMYFESPVLRVDLDSAIVSGSAIPGSHVDISVVRAGRRVAMSGSEVDVIGRFSALPLSVDGEPVAFAPADAVRVIDSAGGEELTASIPVFTLRVDPKIHALTGSAAPNASVEFYTRAAFVGSGGRGSARARADADGTFRYTVPAGNRGGWDALPGTIVEAFQRTIEGQLVMRSWRDLLVSTEVGGARLCGAASPASMVLIDILDASGVKVASAEAKTDLGGYWEAHALDRMGLPFAISASNIVELSVSGNRETIGVPQLSVQPEWVVEDGSSGLSLTVLRGSTAPSAAYQMFGGSDGCLTGRTIPFGVTVIEESSSPDGHFVERLNPHEPGMATLVTTNGTTGLRNFIEARRGLLTVYKGTSRFEARGMPGTPITLTITGGVGSRITEHYGRIDALGNIAGQFQDSGAEVTFTAGDQVTMRFGDDKTSFIVSDVDFDFDASGVIVTSPPDARLNVVFTLLSGSEIRLIRRTGHDGRVRIDAEAILQRSGWRIEEVETIAVTHVTSSGHYVTVTAQPVHHHAPRRVYLPFAKQMRIR